VSGVSAETLSRLACPKCQGTLSASEPGLACDACSERFAIEDGIPLLYWPNEWAADKADVTEEVRAFYEETPFPSYEEFDDANSLIQKARQGRFAKLLDDQVPAGAKVLEVGCGTGQLSNFLSIANRQVHASDLCLNSLRLGQAFAHANGLSKVHFLQMNLFQPAVQRDSFDLVASNGVLHHTSDPFGAYQSIARLVRPGGYLLVGLYHRYGRIITNMRRVVFNALGDRLTFLDPNLRGADTTTGRWRAWFMDQYKHPHESTHTIGEVLGWLEEIGFDFVSSLPASRPGRDSDVKLFEPQRPGTTMERLAVELPMMFKGSREGGFFIVIGRRPE
jgi:SAM-dependent methyltransferase